MQNSDPFHQMISDWLIDEDIVIASGNWNSGALIELIPAGKAEILEGNSQECFSGVREIRIQNSPHHIHLDLHRIRRARYVVSPSVCFNFKPSFEMQLVSDNDTAALSFMVKDPYVKGELNPIAVSRYLDRAQKHQEQHPSLVEFCFKDSSQKANHDTEDASIGPQL